MVGDEKRSKSGDQTTSQVRFFLEIKIKNNFSSKTFFRNKNKKTTSQVRIFYQNKKNNFSSTKKK